jgi:hypothetical protein
MRKFLLLGLLLMLSGGCGLVPVVSAQNADHVIGRTQGLVKVKHTGWSSFVLAVVGTALKNGDTIRLETPSSRATIFCANASLIEVQTSPRIVDCPSNRPVVVRFKGSRVTRVRNGSFANSFPVVVSPRMTKIITDRPLMRWLPVAGATSYRVTLKRGPEDIWTADLGNVTEVVYPAAAPALLPGVTYRLVVSAGSRTSDDDRMPNLGFSLVSPNEARQLEEVASKIRVLQLPDSATRFLLANLYASWGIDPNQPDSGRKALNYEAISQLSVANAQEPTMVRLLADLYLTIGLNGLADEHYRKALSLSEDLNDVEGQALSHYALGRIYKIRLNTAEATQRLNRAKALFQSFGDRESVAKVENELAELAKH